MTLINEIFSDNYQVLKSKIEFPSGSVIVDVGANEGMFSVLMSKMFPQTRILAFEPVPRTYYQLLHNIGLNGCADIEHYNIGVGKPGQKTVVLNVSKEYSGGSSSVCTFVPEDHDQVKVNLISLDEMFEIYKIDHCRLLKVDIEGMEYEVLKDTTILNRVDYMVIELHKNKRLESYVKKQKELIEWMGSQTKLISVDFCEMAE